MDRMLTVTISRRTLLRSGLGATGALLITACAPQQTGSATPTPTSGSTSAAAASAPAKTAAPKVGRLKLAINRPGNETNITWEALSQGTNIQLRHALDPLIGMDSKTGRYVPGLAESWAMTTPDAKTWTVKLRKGVQFHKGYGEFTAKDVVENVVLHTSEGATSSDSRRLRAEFGATPQEIRGNIQTPDDYTVVFKLKTPNVDFPFRLSAKVGTLFMHSKAQLDKEGIAKVRDPKVGPAGTGPWEYVSREPGRSVLFKKVANHWRKTPEFDEMEIFWVPEAATRLAMILTGEAHMAVIDRSQFGQAVAKGMKIVSAPNPSIAFVLQIGGQYYPGLAGHDPKQPALNAKVREAMNRAIDRGGIMKAFFPNGGELMKNMSYYPTGDYWSQRWDTEFASKYSYDPARAKALLAEAGYPNGFDLTVASVSFPALPEAVSISEAVAQNLSAVGIKTTIKTFAQADINKLREEHKAHGVIWPVAGSYRGVESMLESFTSGQGGNAQVPVKEIDDKYVALTKSVNPEERTRLMKEIGDLKFDLYAEIPMIWVPGQIAVDPKVVGEYTFPGDVAAVYSHFEYVKQAQ